MVSYLFNSFSLRIAESIFALPEVEDFSVILGCRFFFLPSGLFKMCYIIFSSISFPYIVLVKSFLTPLSSALLLSVVLVSFICNMCLFVCSFHLYSHPNHKLSSSLLSSLSLSPYLYHYSNDFRPFDICLFAFILFLQQRKVMHIQAMLPSSLEREKIS